jgi:hypothetical protein
MGEVLIMDVTEFHESLDKMQQGMCEFIESLNDERLDWLVMNPPLGDDIIEHGLVCKTCCARIAQAVRSAT